MTLPPLNGTKTHPLSDHARGVLHRLRARGPEPRQAINAGVINRLDREGLINHIERPSPYAVHKGRNIPFVEISEAGIAVIDEVPHG